MSTPVTLRRRLADGQRVAATFVKTAHHAMVEIAGIAGLDAVVLDAEHAPFSTRDIDLGLLAARAAGVSAVVRVPDTQPSTLLRMLDLGADGVLVPHVTSATQASLIVAATRYRDGVRGFSNSARAGRYGARGMEEHIQYGDAQAAVICQIEDAAAIDQLEAIAATDGVDALFVGRADLAVSYRVFDIDHPQVEAATQATLRAAQAAGKAAGIFVATPAQALPYLEQGFRFFVVGSDQAAVRAGWLATAQALQA